MKRVVLLTAALAVLLGLCGCACQQAAASKTSTTAYSATQDNSSYQSGYSSKLGKKSQQ